MSPKKKKKQQDAGPPPKPNRAVIFVAKSYKTWQVDVLKLLQTFELNNENEPVNKDFMKEVRDAPEVKALSKADMKQVMPFASFIMKTEVPARGRDALDLELPFDEAAMLRDLTEVIKRQLNVAEVEICDSAAEHPNGLEQVRTAAGPGKPQVAFLVD
eukprot:TRINITY_DN35718_c1_g1_i2.p1 TRINITY_DN35718_c1_g1~~TRINITY_DN35718_c1_g1_i2.p1  ORF type:complete len:158 (+),score=53.85 TRINITY_DN35718_c1_g1_i2:412-885(+)